MENLKNVSSLNELPLQEGIVKLINPDEYLIDLSQDIPDPVPVFNVHDTLLSSNGNILTIKAKQKSGKTMMVSVFITAMLIDKYLSVCGFLNKKIAWIDTEQSMNQLHKIARRTHRMCSLDLYRNCDKLRFFYASEMEVSQRWELFEQVASNSEYGVIVIDVATDLINDINDQVETKQAVDRLQAIAKRNELLIICTIHENKNDKNATGHFGGSLQKKSEAVVSLTKEKGVFTVQATDTRHGDWMDFSFIVDPDGTPIGIDTPVKLTLSERKEKDIENNLTAILTGVRLTYSELVEAYKPRSGKAERTAKGHISEALNKGLIKQQSDGRYTLTKYTEDENEI